MKWRTDIAACLLPLALVVGVSNGYCKDTAPATPVAAARYQFEQVHMGTRFRLTFYATSEATAKKAAAAAFRRIAQLDARLSHYKDDSELSKLCRRSGSGDWIGVSDDLWKMLTLSKDLSKKTDGAFDVTVGPLVQLWRRSRRR